MDEDYFYKLTGAPKLFGEKGFTPVEQVGARPTLDVNGFLSGFTGEGSKTVLPCQGDGQDLDAPGAQPEPQRG